MAKFLINRYTPLAGETDQMKTIMHNLSIIGHTYKEGFLKQAEQTPFPYVVQICVCGRFVTYIVVSKDLKEGVMRFYDLNNDNDMALDAGAEIKAEWFSPYYFNWFMEIFEQLKPVYSDNYDAAELVLVENAGLLLN